MKIIEIIKYGKYEAKEAKRKTKQHIKKKKTRITLSPKLQNKFYEFPENNVNKQNVKGYFFCF